MNVKCFSKIALKVKQNNADQIETKLNNNNNKDAITTIDKNYDAHTKSYI